MKMMFDLDIKVIAIEAHSSHGASDVKKLLYLRSHEMLQNLRDSSALFV